MERLEERGLEQHGEGGGSGGMLRVGQRGPRGLGAGERVRPRATAARVRRVRREGLDARRRWRGSTRRPRRRVVITAVLLVGRIRTVRRTVHFAITTPDLEDALLVGLALELVGLAAEG